MNDEMKDLKKTEALAEASWNTVKTFLNNSIEEPWLTYLKRGYMSGFQTGCQLAEAWTLKRLEDKK